VIAVTAVRQQPLYLLHLRRAGRLSDSPNPRAVLTYAEPGTSPASPRGFLFCGRFLQASILVGKGERRFKLHGSTHGTRDLEEPTIKNVRDRNVWQIAYELIDKAPELKISNRYRLLEKLPIRELDDWVASGHHQHRTPTHDYRNGRNGWRVSAPTGASGLSSDPVSGLLRLFVSRLAGAHHAARNSWAIAQTTLKPLGRFSPLGTSLASEHSWQPH
jgi:hypothetical protein